MFFDTIKKKLSIEITAFMVRWQNKQNVLPLTRLVYNLWLPSMASLIAFLLHLHSSYDGYDNLCTSLILVSNYYVHVGRALVTKRGEAWHGLDRNVLT